MPLTRREAITASAATALALKAPSLFAQTADSGPALQKQEVEMIDSYVALAMQLAPQSVNGAADRKAARAIMGESITRIGNQVRASRAFVEQYTGAQVKLIVLPEYILTSFPARETIPGWANKAAIDMDGPEYEAMGKIAQANDVYLAGNVYERDPNFPDFYFQANFILGPSGDIVLRYRRLNSMFAPTPHDVWSKYLDIYGLDGVFPVARTPIGNLATIASEEILYPEIARCHALRGAEVFIHPSSEIGSPIATQKAIARRARAFENLAYVVSANTGGIAGTAMPLASADGNSVVIDPKGMVLAESNSGETFTAFAELDLDRLRRHRRKPGMINYLARQRLELFAETYAQMTVHPADSMLDAAGNVIMPQREHFIRTQEAIIRRMDETGML